MEKEQGGEKKPVIFFETLAPLSRGPLARRVFFEDNAVIFHFAPATSC